MEFEFNDEQNQIRSAVANWVQKDYGLVRRRQGINDGGFCRTTLNELGALGLSTQLTLQVTTNSDYVAQKYTTSGDDLRQNFRVWNERSDHVKAWWFTEEDRVHVWEVSSADSGITIDPSGTHTDLNPILQATQQRMGAELRSDDRTIAPQRTVGRFYDYSDVTGDLVEIFRNGIPAPQINMEVGVPLDRFEAAAAALRRVLAASAHVCLLLGGKFFDAVHFDFAALSRWEDFKAVRHRLDPRGRFLHPRLANLIA